MSMKILTALFCLLTVLFPRNAFADEKAEKLLGAVADKMKKTQALSGEYETIRRHLDPPDEIRERGRFRLLKPNFISVAGANFLPSTIAGKFDKISDAAGYVSNGAVFYTLFKQREGVFYKEARADKNGKNLSVNLSPVADFFDESNSLSNQISEARRKNTLTALRYAGEKIWESSNYSVVEFVTDDLEEGFARHRVTQVYIDRDKLARRLIVTEKLGELQVETETLLRNVSLEANLKPIDFAYALPATAKVFVPPPTPLANGTSAPAVSFVDKTGKPVKLSDYRGKTIILDFWATWCAPCLKSFPHTAEVVKKFGAQEIVVLAVNIWDSKENYAYWLAHNPQFDSFKFVMDVENAGGNNSTTLFQVGTLPLQYVISPNGKIVANLQGYFGPNDKLEKAVKAAGDF